MKIQSRGKFWGKTMLAGAALAGMLAFVGAPPARAENYDSCKHNIEKIDHKLHDAATHHGWNSPQADHWRHELNAERDRCWSKYHRWWDEDGQRWHTDHDWDEHDHEHGPDQH
ncbi:MAG: hypothetical protein WA734_08695 [Candidatus Acidiferrales bacterium]